MSKSSRAGSKRSRRTASNRAKHDPKPSYQPPSLAQIRTGLLLIPQELFDQIFDIVFTPTPTKTIHINKLTYSPPIQLQINRSTRLTFAEKYYSPSTSWTLLCSRHDNKISFDTIGLWWNSLCKSHKQLLCVAREEGGLDQEALNKGRKLSGKVREQPSGNVSQREFSFWYRWVVENKEGEGELFEVLRFLEPSEEYDGVSWKR